MAEETPKPLTFADTLWLWDETILASMVEHVERYLDAADQGEASFVEMRAELEEIRDALNHQIYVIEGGVEGPDDKDLRPDPNLKE